jgi:RNA 3'-terminal phosphate cyclase (ATP)
MWSPPVHYLAHVLLPTVTKLGFRADLVVETWGWYPKGGGVVRAQILPRDPPDGQSPVLDLNRRGRLVRIWGISAASNLPHHVIQRQKREAQEVLRKAGLKAEIEEIDAPSPGPGTVVFLVAEYEQALAGFTAYGALRKPAEKVAREAARHLVKFHRSKAAIEPHLADQLLLPIVMAGAEASFTVSEATSHLTTNAWVIEQFLGALVEIRPEEGGARVQVHRRGQHV